MSVLVTRFCRADGSSNGGFKWPLVVGAEVVAPDWDSKPECGKGLHGWLWNQGDFRCWGRQHDDVALLLDVEDFVDLEGKIKFPRAKILLVGTIQACAAEVGKVRGNPGNYGTATAGDHGTATTGDYGTAIAGSRGTATAGHGGTAIAGYGGTAIAGSRGTATAGYGGVIQIVYYCRDNRHRVAIGYVGEDGIEANVPYVVRDGKLARNTI